MSKDIGRWTEEVDDEPKEQWLIVFLVLSCWVPFIVFAEMSGLLLGLSTRGLIVAICCLLMLMTLSVIIVNRLLLSK